MANEANSGQSKPLHHIFTEVPPRYDLINCVLTWGMDRRWRLEAIRHCLDLRPGRVLDLGCGTGDLAIGVARLAGDSVEVVGIDYSLPMLRLAVDKARHAVGDGRVSFIYGDAANLPFPDGYFDCVGISFAFRNLTYKNPLAQLHLAEVRRVLSTGGRYVIVETSQPKSRLIRKLFHLYLRWFVFRVAYLLSGNRSAYNYLAESAARFYTPEEVEAMLLTTGFRQVSFYPLLFGAAGIHVAVR